jgi:hypothetical protein
MKEIRRRTRVVGAFLDGQSRFLFEIHVGQRLQGDLLSSHYSLPLSQPNVRVPAVNVDELDAARLQRPRLIFGSVRPQAPINRSIVEIEKPERLTLDEGGVGISRKAQNNPIQRMF